MSISTDTVYHGQSLSNHPLVRLSRPFIIGGTSGAIAICCVQPIDMIKVRLQLYGEGTKGGVRPTPLSVAKDIVARGKFLDLYEGLSAGVLRQLVYGTARLGLFFSFEDALKKRAETNGSTYNFTQRALASLSAGGIAAFIGNPVEVALIRMQSDGLRPKAERAHYRSVFDALARIVKAEGIRALWIGSYPTIVRAMATNFGQLTFFSETKHQLEQHTNVSKVTRSVVASGVAGFFAALFSLPFDFVKTRMQRQAKTTDVRVSQGVFSTFVEVARTEGPLRFYRGFGTYVLRIAPYTVIALILTDQFKILWP